MPSLKFARTASLSLTNALGIVAGSVGLNALIKSNQIQTKLHHAAPPGTVLIINVHDVLHSGITSTAISAAIGVVTFLFLSFNVFAPRLTEGRPLRMQGAILAFLALWLFAVETAFTLFFATRQAQVHASLHGVEIPQETIAGVEKSLGATRIYKDTWYLRLVAVIPWFTLVSTIISAIILFMAASEPHSHSSKVEMKETNSDEKLSNGV